jgi:hypothetical protein
MASYFSDRERGERPRDQEMISKTVWDGVHVKIKEYFGDKEAFWKSARAEIPSLIDYIIWEDDEDRRGNPKGGHSEVYFSNDNDKKESILMDLVEFSFKRVVENAGGSSAGAFRNDVNNIFSRNSLVFELNANGEVRRLTSQIFLNALTQATFATGDSKLDSLLENARAKFLHPSENIRREALERLWDAFERLKTIELGSGKKARATALLDRIADKPRFREALERETDALTAIGNTLHIRHSETTQEEIGSSEHVDYLFHRLFAFIRLALRTTDRGG